ncbi:HDOD domain-containing protein [Desulfovibrio sp. OttesenSCG-928-C06]|nr:HDOD domain-containing protein [Desulfovibrio sp. OttesenSCG-928-C06]
MSTKINEAHDFLNSLAANPPKLPYEPTLLPKLFRNLSDDSRMSMDGVAKLVERSQGLAAKVLQIANSACYGLQGGVTSLTKAVKVLGLLELRSLVLFFSVSGAIPRSTLPKAFPSQNLWEHQIRTALLGRQIALQIQDKLPSGSELDADSIYTAALLHDLGKVILAARKPEVWAAITEISNAQKCDFATAEDIYWGIDHGTVAAMLLQAWDLPELLTQMISWHHHPELASEYKLEVHILAAANHLAVSGLPEEGQIPAPVLTLLPQYAPLLQQNFAALQETLLSDRAGLMAGFAA